MENVRVHPISTVKVRIVEWVLFYVISSLRVLFRGWIRSPDVLYVREMTYNVLPQIVSKFLRRPVVVEVNGLLLEEMRMIGAGRIELGLIRFFQRLSFRFSDRFVAVAQMVKDGILREYRILSEQVSVVSNGTDPDHFRPMDPVQCRKRLGLDLETPIVGFVGSCYPYHDIDSLIEAAPLILEQCGEVKFAIVGDGYMRKIWMQQASENHVARHFLFTGAVPYAEVPHYMNAFTVPVALFKSIATSANEKECPREITGSPIKLFEYMACGKAVIGTDVRGLRDVLQRHRAGIVISPQNPERVAEAIIKLIEHKSLREEMGRNGRLTVEQEYTWARTAQRVAQVCSEAIAEKRARR